MGNGTYLFLKRYAQIDAEASHVQRNCNLRLKKLAF